MKFLFWLSVLCSLSLVEAATRPAASPTEQAKAMLLKMSLDEKITMLHGNRTNYTGGTPEIVNQATGVRIPPLNLNDGPQGYRSGGTTCWPR